MASKDEYIEVTRGKEHFQPIQYHGLDIGPFTVRLYPHRDESLEDTYERAYKLLDTLAKRDLKRRVPVYLDNVRQVSDTVSDYNG